MQSVDDSIRSGKDSVSTLSGVSGSQGGASKSALASSRLGRSMVRAGGRPAVPYGGKSSARVGGAMNASTARAYPRGDSRAGEAGSVARMNSSQSLHSKGKDSKKGRTGRSRRSFLNSQAEHAGAREQAFELIEDGVNVTPTSLLITAPRGASGMRSSGGVGSSSSHVRRAGAGVAESDLGMSQSEASAGEWMERFSVSSSSFFSSRSQISSTGTSTPDTSHGEDGDDDDGYSVNTGGGSPRGSDFAKAAAGGSKAGLDTSANPDADSASDTVPLMLDEQALDESITLRLTETDTIWMLSIPGVVVAMDGPEAAAVTRRNVQYRELKQSKMGNDNYVERAMQTFNHAAKGKEVQASATPQRDVGVNANVWDIYDSEQQAAAAATVAASVSTGTGPDTPRGGNAASATAAAAAGAGGAPAGGVVVVPGSVPPGTAPALVASVDNSMRGVAASSRMGASRDIIRSLSRSMHVPGGGSDSVATMLGLSTGGGVDTDSLRGEAADMSAYQVSRLETLPAALRTVERILTQNVYHERQVKYRDMPVLSQMLAEERMGAATPGVDEDGEATGSATPATLMPSLKTTIRFPTLEYLWTFSCDLTSERNVSCMTWNPTKPDVLAVGYGEFDFTKQCAGLLLCWSLKNPCYPERVMRTRAGVTSVAFSEQHANLLAVGMYDGNVAVYDVRAVPYDRPVMETSASGDKHSEPVWEVKWVNKGGERGERLVSISTDGRVTEWSMKKGLECTDLMKLKRIANQAKTDSKSEAFINRHASGLCFDFSRADSNVYLAGTEDGNIHKCSCSYNEQYLANYYGHCGPVYRIRWSPFSPRVFLSCSADWTVKVWREDASSDGPCVSMQSGQNAVSDACWSPAISTMFAYVTVDGRIDVWDIKQSTLDPILTHREPSRRFSCVSFAAESPVVVTGDNHGSVNVYRLCNIDNLAGEVSGIDHASVLEQCLQSNTDVSAA